MKANYLLILLIFSVLFFSCDKSDTDELEEEIEETRVCPEEFDMGTFTMLKSSKDLFPYSESDSIVVFKDSLGNEIMGEISEFVSSFSSVFSHNVTCLESTNETFKVKSRNEYLRKIIFFHDINLKFEVRYRVATNLKKYTDNLVFDMARISAMQIVSDDPDFANPIPLLVVLINERNSLEILYNPVAPTPLYSIHSIEYNEVFTNTSGVDVIEIYYNFEKGLIGFKEKSTGILYGFDRFE